MLSNESVISIEGILRSRPEEMINEDQATGRLEVHVSTIKILNKGNDVDTIIMYKDL